MATQIPNYLRANPEDRLNRTAGAGIGAGLAPPRISYRGGRFHLVDKEGVETDPMIENAQGKMEVENMGVAMDMVIVGALPFMSKIYYDTKYDPDVDAAPACFSDNGTGPSDRARIPQSPTCAACVHNVWRLNNETGKQRQACGNIKKLAVVRYHDQDSIVYSLTVPGASLAPFAEQVNKIKEHGIKIGGIIWRVTFDTTVSFPKLDFQARTYLDEESLSEFEGVKMIRTGWWDDIKLALGSDDKPMAPEEVVARKVAMLPAPAKAIPPDKPLPSTYVPPPATVATPVGGPVGGLQPPPEGAGMPGGNFANPPAAAPDGAPAEAPAGRRRGRPRKDPAPAQVPTRAAASEDPAWEAEKQRIDPQPPKPPTASDVPADGIPPMPDFLDRTGGKMKPATPDMSDALTKALSLPT